MVGRFATRSRRRSVGVGLLTSVLVAAGSLAMVVPSAAAAAGPGDASLSDVQVTATGVTAILTARTAGGAKIDPASVKATIGGVAAQVVVQPIAQEHRVATLLIDTSGSMGAAGMAIVVHAADAFLAAVPKDVYVGAVAFSTVPTVITAPTLNRATVRTAIAGLNAHGETSLYDGIHAALAQLGTSGDRSFILLSDGGDTRSRHTLAQTVTALSSSGVRAQVVGFKTTETQGLGADEPVDRRARQRLGGRQQRRGLGGFRLGGLHRCCPGFRVTDPAGHHDPAIGRWQQVPRGVGQRRW